MSKPRRLVVFSNEPILRYYEKGEIKPRYYNPNDFFEEIHLITPANQEVEPDKVQIAAGEARLFIHPIGRPSVIRLPQLLGKASKLVSELKPDVIRGFDVLVGGLLAVWSGRRNRIPVVVSLHTHRDKAREFLRKRIVPLTKIELLKQGWLFLFGDYVLSRADKVICVSNYLVDYAKKHGAEDIEVIYNKVYSDQFNRNGITVTPYDPQRLTILSVGRLDPEKYQECLIRAIVGLDVRLLLIGDGILRRRLEMLIRELGVVDQVGFIRMVPNLEIAKYYWAADIFAMATHHEGFCIPVLEAMSAGLPVVVCNTRPLPEILGDAGLVVEKNPVAFHQAFQHLLTHPEERRTLAGRARARAIELDGHIMEQRECDLYAEMMGSI